MNNRQIEMENCLKKLQKIKLELNQPISSDTVYYYLTKGLLNNNDKGNIRTFFPKFINYFKNKKNINVFNSSNWRYFCQFRNMNNFEKSDLYNPIKMYLSVSKDNIEYVGIKVFDFLEKYNIRHESKIASEVRSDDIVIRIYSKEDEERLYNYINNNIDIKSKLMKPIPFCFQKDNIGYALDGNLSYNSTISKYLAYYINSSNNKSEKVSLNEFLNFIMTIYNNVFINKKDIDNYIEKYIDDRDLKYFSKEEILNNYFEVTKLIILSIKEEKFSYYIQMVDQCNNEELVIQNINNFRIKKEESLDKKIIYFNKAILETYKKYGMEQLIFACQKALNSNFNAFTNTDNAKENLIKYLNRNDIKIIIDLYAHGNINEYLNQIIKNEKDDVLSKKIVYLDEAIKETYLKYGLEQTISAIYYAINKGDFWYFTNNNKARDNLYANLTGFEIKTIINNYANGDVYEYVNKNIDLIKENDNKKK